MDKSNDYPSDLWSGLIHAGKSELDLSLLEDLSSESLNDANYDSPACAINGILF